MLEEPALQNNGCGLHCKKEQTLILDYKFYKIRQFTDESMADTRDKRKQLKTLGTTQNNC